MLVDRFGDSVGAEIEEVRLLGANESEDGGGDVGRHLVHICRCLVCVVGQLMDWWILGILTSIDVARPWTSGSEGV